MKGRKPKPLVLRIVGGNAGKRPLPPPDPVPCNTVEQPPGLREPANKIWQQFIARAWWLTWADSAKAEVFVHLLLEFRKAPTAMVAARIGQLRALASELGFDQGARARMGLPSNPAGAPKPAGPKTTPNLADKYLS